MVIQRRAAFRVCAVLFHAGMPNAIRWEIDPEDEAIVTIGSKEGLAHLMLATLDHGDTVLVPNPSYPIHIYGAVIAGAQVRSVPLVGRAAISLASWNARSAKTIPRPKNDDPRFPLQPDRAVRGAGFL
ncbi:LL-diaminopimelate aminotransferase [Serratia odorifera]|uniref:LL-diaminopimelate aminotransferase n=1 Tax=Serratia odorifera TaxID=618 RepID=A0A3S4DMX7_SEROD|nr:LL-diaminopimelate aminotransferase [Serratia odorifera]